MPQKVLPELSGLSPKSAPQYAITHAGRPVAVLPGLLDAFLSVLLGPRASALLSCVPRTTFGRPNATEHAPGAVRSVDAHWLLKTVPEIVLITHDASGVEIGIGVWSNQDTTHHVLCPPTLAIGLNLKVHARITHCLNSRGARDHEDGESWGGVGDAEARWGSAKDEECRHGVNEESSQHS